LAILVRTLIVPRLRQASPEKANEDIVVVTEDDSSPSKDDGVKYVAPGILVLNYNDTIVKMHVPSFYTFGDLLVDGLRYFQVDRSMVRPTRSVC